jgi:hypothetical protein
MIGRSCFLRESGEGLEVRHGQAGVTDRFQIDRLGLSVDQGLEARRLHAVREPRLDADVLEGVLELVVGAAVEVRGGDKVVAHRGDVVDREELGRMTGRGREGRDAAFERGDALFEHIVGRIHDPRVDVTEFLQREQAGAVG